MRRKYTRWDDNMLYLEALKYTTRSKFQKGSKTAYSRCLERGILDKTCSHMVLQIKSNGYWTFDTILKEALKYKTRISFANGCGSASITAHKLGIINEVCKHMTHLRHRNNYWTFNKLTKEASKYSDVGDFKRNNKQAYDACKNNKMLDVICSHMVRSLRGFNKEKPAILYYLSIDGGIAYKIGITNKTVEQRFSSEELSRIIILNTIYYQHGVDTYNTEQKILKEFKYAKYEGDSLLINGNTELFDRDVLGLDNAV